MILFDFECKECATVTELFANQTTTTMTCPRCHNDMTKVITGTRNFEFKGEGTYSKGRIRHGG